MIKLSLRSVGDMETTSVKRNVHQYTCKNAPQDRPGAPITAYVHLAYNDYHDYEECEYCNTSSTPSPCGYFVG